MPAAIADVQARNTNGTDIVGDYPAGIGATNESLVLALIGDDEAPTVSSGLGAWTELHDFQAGSDLRIRVYTKVAASESGTITVTMSASSNFWIGIAHITGTSGIDASAESVMGFSGTTHDSPSISMTNAGQRWLSIVGGAGGDGTWAGTVPSGSAASAGESGVSQNFNAIMGFADRTFAGAGATGAQQWTTLPSGEYKGAVSIGFLDAGGGGDEVVLMGQACL